MEPRLRIRPIDPADIPALRQIHATEEVAEWWGEPGASFPERDDPDATRLTIELEGEVAGLIQYSEENDPQYRHATIDVFVDPQKHGRGVGAEAVRQLACTLIDQRGHHRITIDPTTTNAPAIRAYEKAGFKPVGVMRKYTCIGPAGEWRDGLLMDLLAGEECRHSLLKH
jgi:aminoglycoside 6'-N-acetyltransferase